MKPKEPIRQMIPDDCDIVEINDTHIIATQGDATVTFQRYWYQYPGEKPRLQVIRGGYTEKTTNKGRMSL